MGQGKCPGGRVASIWAPLAHSVARCRGRKWGSRRRVVVTKFRSDGHTSKPLYRGAVFALSWRGVGHIVGMPHSVGPEAYEYHPLPFVHGIQHARPGLFLEIPDPSLSNPILKVGVDTTIRQTLPLGVAVRDEGIVREPPVVGVVVQYLHPRCSAALSKACLACTVSSLVM